MTPELGGSLEEIRPGRRLHVAVRDIGADTTLFFLHGAGGNKEQWRFQWDSLGDVGCNLVAWDAIGHGRSPKPRKLAGYAGTELVADARVMLDRHRTRRTILVAHSYGTRVALALLLQGVPIDGLVLVGPPPLGQLSGRRLLGGVLGLLPLPLLELARPLLAHGFRQRAWHPDADPEMVRTEERAARRNRLSMMQALLANAPVLDEDRVSEPRLPILVLAGEQDGIVPIDIVARLTALLPGAELRRIDRCGHQVMLERPGDTDRAIRDMILAVRKAQVP
ncbi:alpha/beta fold hydrolase [Lichenicola sp.]|uniref:alpha/beta fold hydrolase n=1 Tax=Lichenicola sp. TaxID=2804529 RepID=UPI003AFF8065